VRLIESDRDLTRKAPPMPANMQPAETDDGPSFRSHAERLRINLRAFDEILDLTEAARRAGLGRRSLERLIASGEGPPVLHLTGKKRGVLASDIQEWVLSRRRAPPRQAAAA
jgi:predicted DNA-binding transcriptional regulator AlpA